jgi:branched-chain amino acid transport system substrate-binding protein
MLNKRLYIGLIAVCLCLILAAGCGVSHRIYPKKKVTTAPEAPAAGPPPDRGPAARELLNQAERAQIQGEYQEARELYQAFVSKYPDAEDADSAWAALGHINEILGLKTQAASAYQKVLERFPWSRFAGEAKYRLALLHLESGRYDRSADLLLGLIDTAADAREEAALRNLLGRAFLGQGQRPAALEQFVRSYHGTPDPMDKEEARRGIMAVAQAMTPLELAEAQEALGDRYPADYITYILAYRLYQLGRGDEAHDQIEYLKAHFPSSEYVSDADTLARAVDGEGQPPILVEVTDFGRFVADVPGDGARGEGLIPQGPLPPYQSMDVAAILTLSEHRGAKYGKKILEGLELAFAEYQPQTQGFHSELVIHDAQGKPDEAYNKVDQAAAHANILAGVGPFMQNLAGPAAERAQTLQFPLITLTRDDEVQNAGEYVFRLFMTFKDQAEAAARYAVQVEGLYRLAVFYPEDSYGEAMRDWFQDAAEALGAEIVAVEGYDPKGVDFSADVQALTGVGKARRNVAAGRTVDVGIDAVFIPDSYRGPATVVPFFAFHDLTGIRYIGTTLWHNPTLLTTEARRHIQNCIIPAAFYPSSDRPETQTFVSAYQRRHGADAMPDRFAAYGYDAGTLLLILMDQYHVSTREGLRQALANMGSYQGVTGRFSFGPNGQWRGEPVILTVYEDTFRSMEEVAAGIEDPDEETTEPSAP